MLARSLLLVLSISTTLTAVAQSDVTGQTNQPTSNPNFSELQNVYGNNISPIDVFTELSEINERLTYMMAQMGIKPDQEDILSISNASPREIYYQAIHLVKMSNRLSNDYLNKTISFPSYPRGGITSSNIFTLVNLSLGIIKQVQDKLKIKNEPQALTDQNIVTPSNIFNTLLNTTVKMSNILKYRTNPTDTYAQLQESITYTAALLQTFPNSNPSPTSIEVNSVKYPLDVFNQLVNCYNLVKAIGAASGIKMLDMNINVPNVKNVDINEVDQLSYIILSEIAYLYEIKTGLTPNVEKENLIPKFHSDLFQQGVSLQAQLQELLAYVKSDPDWLDKHN